VAGSPGLRGLAVFVTSDGRRLDHSRDPSVRQNVDP
jgi:hypothetical protein